MTDIELVEKCGLKIAENIHGVKIVVAMVDNYAGHITLEELQAYSDAIRQDQIEKDEAICRSLFNAAATADECAEAIRNQLRKEDE